VTPDQRHVTTFIVAVPVSGAARDELVMTRFLTTFQWRSPSLNFSVAPAISAPLLAALARIWSWATGAPSLTATGTGGLLAREQRDRKTEREKLAAALDIFTELNMPRERDAVRAELEKRAAADRAT